MPDSKKPEKIHLVQLRLDEDLVKDIDIKRDKYKYRKLSRHAWIVDAIVEKLEKEGNQ